MLQTFGAPALRSDDGGTATREISIRRKDLALLIYLCVERRRVHSREQLASLLWGDASEERARHSLTQALARLRSRLGEEVLVVSADGVEWRGRLRSDVAGLSDGTAERTVELPTYAFLADFVVGRGGAEFEIWAEQKRSYYRRQVLRFLDRAGQRAEDAGSWGEALSLGRQSIDVDGIHEEGHRRIMRAWSAMGERGLALQHYRNFRQWLQTEFEEDPEVETSALAEQLSESGGTGQAGAKAHRRVVSPGQRTGVPDWLTAVPIDPPSRSSTGRRAIRSGWSLAARMSLPVSIGASLLVMFTLATSRWLDPDEAVAAPDNELPALAGPAMAKLAYNGPFVLLLYQATFLDCPRSADPGLVGERKESRNGLTEGIFPSSPENFWMVGFRVPAECRRFGIGSVRQADVVSLRAVSQGARDRKEG